MKQRLRLIEESSGATLVEAALILPLILLFVFGIIQYGLIISAQITLNNAAVISARAAVLDGATSTSVTSVATQAIQPMLSAANLTQVNVTPVTLATGTATRVELVYSLPLLIHFVLPGNIGGQMQIRASMTMK